MAPDPKIELLSSHSYSQIGVWSQEDLTQAHTCIALTHALRHVNTYISTHIHLQYRKLRSSPQKWSRAQTQHIEKAAQNEKQIAVFVCLSPNFSLSQLTLLVSYRLLSSLPYFSALYLSLDLYPHLTSRGSAVNTV